MKRIVIGPGDFYITSDPRELIVTVLGSCVAACIRDPVARIGGMNHFMLPQSGDGSWGEANEIMRFGNFAMDRLCSDMVRRGAQMERLEAKVFGGAAVLTGHFDIGDQNAAFVESYLLAAKLTTAAAHLRGTFARRVEYAPISGRVMMLEMRRDIMSARTFEGRIGSTEPPRSAGQILPAPVRT